MRFVDYDDKRERLYQLLLVHAVCKGNQIKANEGQMK